MARNFAAGVADVTVFAGDQILMTAKTLIQSSISIGSSAEEIRGGSGNKLFGKYYHTSTFDISLEDVMFKLEYFAFNTGSAIAQGGDVFTKEQITITDNTGTITGTPAVYENYGTIGWVSIPGTDDVPEKVTFTNGTFDYTAPNGTVVCVSYMSKNMSSRHITINSAFVPSEVKLVMSLNLFRAGANVGGNNINASSRSGRVEIVVPRFQFSGTQEFSMTSSGYSTSPINGSALDVQSADCEEGGYYAIITEILDSATWYENVHALALNSQEIDLTVTEGKDHTFQMVVYALPKNGSNFPAPLGGEDGVVLTVAEASIASVSSTGLVTGLASGNTTITATIPNKPGVQAVANVKVV